MIKIFMPFTSQMLNSTAMTRTEMIRNNEGYVNRLSQDYDLWLSIGSISKMKNLDGFYAKYRVHDNNVSVTRRMEQIRSSIKSLKLHKKFTNIIFRQGGIYFRSIYICYLKYIKKWKYLSKHFPTYKIYTPYIWPEFIYYVEDILGHNNCMYFIDIKNIFIIFYHINDKSW